MKFYFATGNSRRDVEMLMEEGANDILISYAHFRGKPLPDYLNVAKKKGANIMIDSGAFTNYNKPGSVTLPIYLDFLRNHADEVTEYAVLDDLRKRGTTVRNYKIMKEAGFNPIFIDHLWFAHSPVLDPIYASGSKMGWGGMVYGPQRNVPTWEGGTKAKFLKRLEDRGRYADSKPKTMLHLFGVGQRAWRFLPWLHITDSMDSSTWVTSVGKYGRIPYYVAATPESPVPKFRQLDPKRDLPQDLRNLIKASKLDLNVTRDRMRLAIREMMKYFRALEKFHTQAVKRGMDMRELAKFQTDEQAWGSFVSIGKRMWDTPEPTHDFTIETKFLQKKDDAKRLVTGIVLEPEEVDSQGDIISVDVIEETAHKFLQKFNVGTQMGVMHEIFGKVGILLSESWVAKSDCFIGQDKIKKGTWLMTVKITSDNVWEDVKKGKLTGFSIGGTATIEHEE